MSEDGSAPQGISTLEYLPAGSTFTAELAAYKTLLDRVPEHFAFGVPPGFDVTECADNPYNDWIGAQIRADLYGRVWPGRPALAAKLALQDAAELARLDVRLQGATSEESDAQQGRA